MPNKSYSKEEFIRKARIKHGDRYLYDKVNYVDARTLIIVTCRIHSDFLQNPNNHLRGSNCKECVKIEQSNKRRMTLKEFITRANNKYGEGAYDYSKVEFKNTKSHIKIICFEHGEFTKTVGEFLRGRDCNECEDNKMSFSEFLEISKRVHGDLYDYSEVDYKNKTTKVKIICRKLGHPPFFQAPYKHIIKQGCPKCKYLLIAQKTSSNTEEFIAKAKEKWGKNENGEDFYDYSEVVYKNSHEKVKITCNKHKVTFMTTPTNHLGGKGCRKCGNESIGRKLSLKYEGKTILTTEDFVAKSISLHGKDVFDYSKVEYINIYTKVHIICKLHNFSFYQAPKLHYRKDTTGCSMCLGLKIHENLALTTEEFIDKASIVHRRKPYDYSKVEYTNYASKIIIICKEHGPFTQVAGTHLSGSGCKKCHTSLGELAINTWLTDNKIEYEPQYSYTDLKGLGSRNLLRFDFYIPSINLLIEYQGLQHYKPVQFKSMTLEKAVVAFKKQQINDALKNKYCLDHNIPLLRIPYTEFKRIPEILSDTILKSPISVPV